MKLGIAVILACISLAAYAMEPEVPRPSEPKKAQPLFFERLPRDIMLPLIQTTIMQDINGANTIQEAIQKIQERAKIDERFARMIDEPEMVQFIINGLLAQFPQETDQNSFIAALFLSAQRGGQEWLDKNIPGWIEHAKQFAEAIVKRSPMHWTMTHALILNALLQIPLIKHYIVSEYKGNIGQTALIDAVNAENIATVQMLLDAGADPNVPDKDGWTPLMYLAAKNIIGYGSSIAMRLLENGADVQIKNKWGQTAINIAVHAGNKDLARLMEKYYLEAQLSKTKTKIFNKVKGVFK